MVHILVVEDEEHLAKGIKFNLEAEGYKVTLAPDGNIALELLADAEPRVDLVILDLMLPGMSGYSVCETLRATGMNMPVLMLSARTLAEDRTRGFDVGADQYLTKPFELDELLSRVNVLLNRHQGRIQRIVGSRGGSTFEFHGIKIDFEKYQVTVHDELNQLTPLEMKLLEYLVRHEGRVITRNELLEKVWKRSGRLTTRAPDQFIRRLRKIIEENPSEPRYLLTIRDAGYRFVSNPT